MMRVTLLQMSRTFRSMEWMYVVDIHANCLATINDLTAYTQKSVDAFEINDLIVNEPIPR